MQGSEQLGDILAKILPRRASPDLQAARWKKITSETEQRWSQVSALKGETLHVIVRNSALHLELKTYRKHELIAAWNRLPGPKITSIKFKVV